MSPTPTVAGRPGSFESAKPRRIRIAALKTTTASAMRIGAAGRLERARMPIGVAAQVPSSRSPMDRHRTSFQICGRRVMLVTTSNISTIGTTCRGGSASERLVIQSIDAPNPV